MCGINGIVLYRTIPNLKTRIEKMNKSIKHRGPDGCGYNLIDNRIALGHCRLSIIDIDKRASQPMTSNSGRWTIVFNGEIYNFEELKKETSYLFKTHSDTEAILAYVEEYGVKKFLQKSNGMFAMALYDHQTNDIWIARDRFGIKPFYYYMDKDKVVFSSEIKGILSSGLVKAEFYETAIDEYLGNRYVREPYTFFRNIFQLESGCFAKISPDLSFRKHRYWSLPIGFNVDQNYSEEAIRNEFGQRFETAVRKRMVADVPLGTYLSGGVDSSLISAVVSQNSSKQINTYTIGFETLNEFPYAQLVANQYNTKHHSIYLKSESYFELLQEIISFKDSPLGVPNEILLAEMSKVLKQSITVVLSGEGADELLGGYGRIFRSGFDYENIPQLVDFYTYFIDKYEYVPRMIRDKYLNISSNLRNEFDSKIISEFSGKQNNENIFRFFHNYHIKGLLQRVDTTTMLAGVEARVPFLDHTLVEYSYHNIPYDLKLHWNSSEDQLMARNETAMIYSEKRDTPKYLLKQYAKDWLPAEIINRKKVGFPVPLNDWIDDLIIQAQSLLKSAYWLHGELLNELISDCQKCSRAGQILWMFINIEIFRKMYFEKEWQY